MSQDFVETAEWIAAAVSETTGIDCPLDRPLVDAGLESFRAVAVQRMIADHAGVVVPLREFLGAASPADLARCVHAQGGSADHSDDHSDDHSAGRGDRAASPAGVHDSIDGPFPLTPVQTSYWIGRGPDYPLGGVSTHFYFEFDRTTGSTAAVEEIAALERSWNTVVTRHPMLRAVVRRDGLQQVVADPGIHRIVVHDLRDRSPAERDEAASEIRRECSHRCAPAHRWPVHGLTALILDADRIRLCLSFDVLLMDFTSWRLVMAEWGVVHRGGDLPAAPTTGFAALLAEQSSRRALDGRRERDLQYWSERADLLPAAVSLPAVAGRSRIGVPHFRRHRRLLDEATWAGFEAACVRQGMTPSGAMLAVFGEVLRRWGAGDRFSLTVTLFDRPADLAGADSVVGDFTTTALIDMTAVGADFADRAAAVAASFWDAIDHSSVSGVEVARMAAARPALPGDDGMSGAVVFTSALDGRGASADPTGWIGEEVFGVSQTPQVLLDAIAWRSGADLVLAWDAVEGAFPDGLVDGMQSAFVNAISLLATDDRSWASPTFGADPFFRPIEPRLRPAAEVDGPGLAAPLLHAGRLHPDRPAVLTESSVVDHHELVEAARGVAAELRSRRGDADPDGDWTVIVGLPKGPIQIASIVGVLIAGGAYVPVDPLWPSDRIARVAARSGARYAITDDDIELPSSVIRVSARPAGEGTRWAAHRPGPSDLAYAIFTSGSTGEPKGVAIEHDQARTTVDDINRRFHIDSDDRVLGLSALSFDLSVWDVFGVLGAGGGIVLPTPGRERDPAHWLDLIERHGVTVWNTAPQLMEMLVEYSEAVGAETLRRLRSIRLVLMSGDWIPVTLPDRIRALMPGAEVVSLGGATEASIWSIHHRIGRVDADAPSIPYGTALSGQWFRLLDEPDGRPVPVGEPGELFIGGGGVARGYLGDPEQTARRFRVHPVTGERLYHTGDMGRWRPDGTIEFLGRNDRQVKINGFRIELGEIDAALSRHPHVRAAVAASRPGPDGRPRLVAYVVPRASSVEVDVDALREHCRGALPAYMVPPVIEIRGELPMTANGKIDHAALTAPADAASATVAEPTAAEPTAAEPAAADPTAAPETPDIVGRVSADEMRALVGSRFPTDVPLIGAGADSMLLVRVANLIEDRTGTRPGFAELAAATVADLVGDARTPIRPQTPVPAVDDAPAPSTADDPILAGVVTGLPLDVVVRSDVAERSAVDLLIDTGTWLRRVDEQSRRGGFQVHAEFSDLPGHLCRIELRPRPDHRSPARPRTVVSDVADTDPRPLTEMQLAYFVGRADDWLGAPVAPHYYSEVDVDDLDVESLRAAHRRLVGAHPMLRAHGTPDAKQRLAPAGEVPDVEVRDLRDLPPDLRDRELSAFRAERSQWVRDVFGPGWFSLTATRIDARRTRLHVELDMLFCDVVGAAVLADDLLTLYRGGEIAEPGQRFLDWADRNAAEASAGPQRTVEVVEPRLPMRRPDDTTFDRRRLVLSAAQTQGIHARAAACGSTLDALLLTLYADALRLSSGAAEGFSIVVTALARPAGHERVVGEYSSTIVVTPRAVGDLADRAATTAADLFDALDARGARRVSADDPGGPPPVLPIVYSSGLTASRADGRDASELLAGFGRPVYSISQTPQVLVDMQTFLADDALVVNWDAVSDAFADGFLDAAFTDFRRRLEALADGRGSPGDPQAPMPPQPLSTASQLRRKRVPAATRPADPVLRERIRSMLADTLGVPAESVDVERSFFDVGATSLNLVALHRALVDDGLTESTVLDLFESGSIAALAERLRPPPSASTEESDIPAPNRSRSTLDPLARAHARGNRRRGGVR